MIRPALLGLAVAIAGCAHAPSPRGAPPPDKIPDLVKMPDAVPRTESRSALGNPPFYQVGGHRYIVLASAEGYVERGVASWYGPAFHGGRTAMGEPYDMYGMSAAHKTLPIPCFVRVTNLGNGKSVVVRINDRGPFVGNRIIDLSYTAALKLDMVRHGTAFVQVQTIAAPGTALAAPPSLTAAASAPAAANTAAAPPQAQANALAADVSAAPTPTLASAAAVDAAAPTATTAAVPLAQTLFIQVGAYADSNNARRAAEKLRAAGLEQVFTLLPPAGQTLLRVRIGPITRVDEFDALIARLLRLGFSGARLAQD